MRFKIIASIVLMLTVLPVFSQEENLQYATIPEGLLKNANAVVRLNDVDVTIEKRNKMTVTTTRIVTVLNEKGNKYVEAYQGFDNHRKIKRIQAIIYNENGEETKKIRKRDFIDQSAVDGGTLYSDSRVLYMAYMPVTYPYTVKFECEFETPNTAFIPSWRPITGYYLGIENNTYTVNDQVNLGLRFKKIEFDTYTNIEVNHSANSLEFKLLNQLAQKPEQLSPGLSKITPKGMIAVDRFNYYGVDGNASNWQEFGDWMINSLLTGRDVISNTTKNEIQNLVKGVQDPIEKAKLIYKYVQDNTRYISVQVGIGGNQPIPALEVDKLKYGDCKGLTNYTQALLKEVGVPSYYSVVQAGSDIEGFDHEFASLAQGNHIILGIPNNEEVVWIDCTSQEHPFGFIGDFTDNREVLLVKEGGSEIIKTTKYADSLNTQITKAKVNLDRIGNLSSELEIKTTGIQYDSRFIIETGSKKEILEYYKNYWRYINNIEIDTYAFENNKSKVEFTEKLEVNARNYASINSNQYIISPNIFNKNTFVPDRYRNRKTPFVIQRGYLDKDEFELSIPEGYEIEAIPEAVKITNDFGSYSMECLKENDKIIYKRKLYIKAGDYKKEEYESYRKFRRKISKIDKSILVLKKI